LSDLPHAKYILVSAISKMIAIFLMSAPQNISNVIRTFGSVTI
jgi:hypothetical protein